MIELNINFTQHELEVLKWLALSKSDAIIADILKVPTPDINKYIYNIFQKLDVLDRTQASLRAIMLGIV